MSTTLLLRGGCLVPGDGQAPHRADLLIRAGRIAAVGEDLPVPDGAEVLDAGGRLVVPGFVDAHSHAEAAVLDPEVQLALLRQGVTTVIAGQDGVSYAPGDGAHASAYFAAINGAHPTYRGSRVADLLATYDGRIPLSVAYLVMAAVLCGRPYLAEDAVKIGASPVCALVFSLLTLAMAVVCICLLRRKSPPPEEETGPAVLPAEAPAAENSQENN